MKNKINSHTLKAGTKGNMLCMLSIGIIISIVIFYLQYWINHYLIDIAAWLGNNFPEYPKNINIGHTYSEDTKIKKSLADLCYLVAFTVYVPLAFWGVRYLRPQVKRLPTPTWFYVLYGAILLITIWARMSQYDHIPFPITDSTKVMIISGNLLHDIVFSFLAVGICMPIFMKVNHLTAIIGALSCGLVYLAGNIITDTSLWLALPMTLFTILFCLSRIFKFPAYGLIAPLFIIEIIF